MNFVLGTAGHIDHGKTALVRALTGINCDRLEEERRRGITIELGFAWMDLPDGRKLGIVDVPGHDRFIKNMVAGASGVDFILLVIAADEGIMPQTREHLEICSLLGVRSGLVALTKTDLVDPEWLNFITEDVKNSLATSFLANAPIIPVSSATRDGIEKLRHKIITHISSIKPCIKTDLFRLPVDRVFSMKGYGTVVTGTLVSGSCMQGERLSIVPSGKSGRARSLQVHGEMVESVHAGQRCAINLQGLELCEVRRGDIIAKPDTLIPSQSWLIRLHCLQSSPLPIRQRMEVHFHHGSRECLAKIILRDCEILEPGQTAIAEVRFDNPMAAVYGDHYVLRAHSPLRAIGGGTVINPLPPMLNRRQKDYSHKLALIKELGESDMDCPYQLALKASYELAATCLKLYPAPGLNLTQLRMLTSLPCDELNKALHILEEKKEAFCWDQTKVCWISASSLENCLKSCILRAQELHAREPLKSSFAPSALIAGWGEGLPEKFTQELLNLAIKRGILCQEGAGLKISEHKTKLDSQTTRLLSNLKRKIKAGGLTPPFIKELIDDQGWEIKKIQPLLNHLCENGELLKIQDGVYYDKQEFAVLMEKIKNWFAIHEELEVGNIKTICGISRKYAIPILEYLDSIHMTCRDGNKRRLRKDYSGS